MMQASLGLCTKGKLDGDSFVQYMQLAKQHFPPAGHPHDEFGQSLIESIWVKHAEIPKLDLVAQESFRNTLKPIVGLLVEK